MDLTRYPAVTTWRSSRSKTGCTTCRSRRVKCDERRPVCHNCSRLRKKCGYLEGHEHDSRLTYSSAPVLPTSTGINQGLGQEALSPSMALLNSDFDLGEWGDILEDSDWLGSSSILPSAEDLSSHTTRQDSLERGSNMFPYFTSSVNPPFITPFDSANWDLARQYIAGLAPSNTFIAAAIQCVQVLYRSLDQGNDISDAMQSYFSAKSIYLTMLSSDDQGLEPVLIVTFLLCIFEIVAQQEMIPHTLKQKDPLISKIDTWAKLQPWPPIARRITVWLRWLHTKSMHLGGRGILSPQIFALLPVDRHPVPPLFFLHEDPPEPGLELLEPTMSALFHFYDELQDISVQASALNRHHRSRGTVADETGVHWISINIANHLNSLWQTRPWLLRHPTTGLFSSHLQHNQLCDMLVVLCRVCYFAETIYLDRAQSKDRTASPDAQRARQEIRLSVDEFSSRATTQKHLDAAFLWPLFLYAVESRTGADVDWALSKLRLIQDPLWQSETVTTFIQDLTSEQLSRGERVDSRLFCLQRYGGPPPYI
ncbi:hypothetical protein H2204_012184 [Knufia peltigerae]|uniref:Zn(2)-C6 fungal-type domain-containing protein n=1 Tax=Knufia peltigerae TaxID=1002370 RepID=A0AA38XT57_9EURO|nr:hypothetical protein H2204_012184 [Knufia peltigerae]